MLVYRGHGTFLNSMVMAVLSTRKKQMRLVLIASLLIAATAAYAQPADVNDKLCIFAAARQIPVIQGTEIKASRIKADPNSKMPGAPNQRFVEIDVSAAGQTATYVFNCLIKETTISAIPHGILR